MISVITAVYNGEKFINCCLDSVIKQQCSETEHIIIDGGSVDKTLKIVKEYSENYDHIRWISETDAGQSDAMNKGIAIAKGSIIGFLNADDFYEADVLNRIVEIFTHLSEPALVVGNCNVWGNSGELRDINKPSKLRLCDLIKGPHINRLPENPSAYFYHKSLHDHIGLYDIDDHYSMDVDFLFRAVQKASVSYYNEVWGNFRLIEGTKTYRGLQTGQTYHREKRICVRYRNCTSSIGRLYYSILFECQNSRFTTFFEYIFKKLLYFLKNPKELVTSLKAKVTA